MDACPHTGEPCARQDCPPAICWQAMIADAAEAIEIYGDDMLEVWATEARQLGISGKKIPKGRTRGER
jgi:hypothetical protein